jgi:hypothetical protein
LLDAILRQSPLDAAARTQRASVRLVRGDFAGARADCAQLMASGASRAVALACLAESLGARAASSRRGALLAAYPLADPEPAVARPTSDGARPSCADAPARSRRAIADYRAALALAPARRFHSRLAGGRAGRARRDCRGATRCCEIERRAWRWWSRARLHAAAGARRLQPWRELAGTRGRARRRAPQSRSRHAGARGRDAARALAAAEKNFRLAEGTADVRVLARGGTRRRRSRPRACAPATGAHRVSRMPSPKHSRNAAWRLE